MGADNSVFIGYRAGYNELSDPDFLTIATNPYGFTGGATFIGSRAGYGASNSVQSTMIGTAAGYKANNALASTILGFMAGYNTNYAAPGVPGLSNSLVIGTVAAQETTGVDYSVIIGTAAGQYIDDMVGSIIIGPNAAGAAAVDMYDSVFLGSSAGSQTNDIVSSVAIGAQANGFSNLFNGIAIGANVGVDQDFNNQKTKIQYSNLVGTFQEKSGVVGNISGCSARIISDNGSELEIDKMITCITPGETITDMSTGATATVVAITTGTSSILIGNFTASNGYQNSIALGSEAMNTADNQFMIGSEGFPIDEVHIRQSSGLQCIIDLTGLGCTSDERLKTNIKDLSTSILDQLTQVRTVSYNWKSDPKGNSMIGFLAQDLEQYFPQLVGTDADGKKTVNYAAITPVLTEAIRELSLKIENIESAASVANQEGLMAWFADVANGITDFFADSLHAKNQICIDDVCVTKTDFQNLLNQRIQDGVSDGFGYGYGN